MQLVPNSWGTPLREFNPCHSPKGARGGQFCSTEGGSNPIFDSYSPSVQQQLTRLSGVLMEKAGYKPGIFGAKRQSDRTNEVMTVVDLDTGDQLWDVMIGEHKAVPVTEAVQFRWSQYRDEHEGGLLNIHTHPSGSAPSLEDFRVMNAFNWEHNIHSPKRQQPGNLLISTVMVMGSDGSVFEIGLKKLYPENALKAVIADHQLFQTAARIKAEVETDKAILAAVKGQTLPIPGGKWVGSPPMPPDVRQVVKDAYKKATGNEAEALHEKNWQLASTTVWEKLASEHGFTFRSYLPQRDRGH